MASGSFNLAFSSDFEVYEAALPSGVISVPLMSQYWLNDFNKRQEINSIWNK